MPDETLNTATIKRHAQAVLKHHGLENPVRVRRHSGFSGEPVFEITILEWQADPRGAALTAELRQLAGGSISVGYVGKGLPLQARSPGARE